MALNGFKIGDRVVYTNTGQEMTIDRVFSDTWVFCTWYNEVGTGNRSLFPVANLVKTEEEKSE
ncbi:hypothetical protein ACFL5V_09695 [Fibrobacterota bacterium]